MRGDATSDPAESARAALSAMTKLVGDCTPENQPSRELVDFYLGLLDRSGPRVDESIQETLREIRTSLSRLVTAHAFSP